MDEIVIQCSEKDLATILHDILDALEEGDLPEAALAVNMLALFLKDHTKEKT